MSLCYFHTPNRLLCSIYPLVVIFDMYKPVIYLTRDQRVYVAVSVELVELCLFITVVTILSLFFLLSPIIIRKSHMYEA